LLTNQINFRSVIDVGFQSKDECCSSFDMKKFKKKSKQQKIDKALIKVAFYFINSCGSAADRMILPVKCV